jgi:hypothetical protein
MSRDHVQLEQSKTSAGGLPMTTPWSCVVLAVVAASPAFGSDPRAATEPAVKIMAAFRKEAGVTFKECPDEKCIPAALRSCTPVHVTVKISTIEGTPAIFDHFVVKRPEGCRLVTFSDYTKDYWGGCKVRRQVCPNLKASESDDSERLGCSPSEILFTAKVCKNPTRQP